MNPIRLPHAKTLLLASASAAVLMISQAAHARPLSESVLIGGSTGNAINPTSPIPGLPSVVSTQAQAQAQQARTTANLADAAARIQVALTAQTNARTAAQGAASNIPNGLAAGGLNPDSGLAANGTANAVLTWVGADTPTQAAANGQTTVTVNQTQQAAILNWQTFNVGAKTTVNFVQKDSTGADQTSWVALNKVNDPNAKPSQIAGQITAPGSVYIVNRNGVIFTGTSQINVHSLIAAATDFDNTQFLTNGIYSATTTDNLGNKTYSPSFVNANGDVVAQAGAQINTTVPSSVTAGGGQIIFLGKNVENDGQISTPVGQIILAAGDNFLLRPGYSSDGSNNFSTTNGVEIAPVELTGSTWVPGGNGDVTNKGYLSARQGDITLAGHSISQDGVIVSTTSVATRGTIHLLNSISDAAGSITLGAGALTDVMPELDSTDTALDAQRLGLGTPPTNPVTVAAPFDNQFSELTSSITDKRYQSLIDIVTGGTAEFKGTSLSLANAGQINVSAQKRVQVDSGALLDVSGVNVALPASANVLTINVQGNEERDDPNNRDDGLLFNEDVYVDERDLIEVAGDPNNPNAYPTNRYYTPGGLLEVSGELANQGYTEGEWASSGGSVMLSTDVTSGSVIAQSGANINLEGGSIAYQAGRVPTTWLRAADGSIYNINSAPANETYVGQANSFQVDHTRWVVTDNFSGGLFGGSSVFQPGYVVGRDAGSLTIASATTLFNSSISAAVVAGIQQTSPHDPAIADPFLQLQTATPRAGGLLLAPLPTTSGIVYSASDFAIGAGTNEGDSLGISDALPTDVVNTTKLNATALNSFGLGAIDIEAETPVSVEAPITLVPGGQLTLHGSTVSIASNIAAHGGAVTAIADGYFIGNPGIGLVDIGPDVTIDTTGLWTNASSNPQSLGGLAFVNGGAVYVSSTGNIVVGQGSLVDASSGAGILTNGTTVGGQGGDISLLSNYIPLTDVNSTSTVDQSGTSGIILDGTLRSYGVTKGGALALQGYTLLIGDSSEIAGGILAAGTPAPANLTLSNTVLPNGQILASAVTPSQPYTIKAGTPLPFAYTYNSPDFTPAGTALSSELLMPGNNFLFNPNARCIGCAVTDSDWTIPVGASGTFNVYNDNNGGAPTLTPYSPGQTIPAGSIIEGGSGTLPVGYIVPASVFPTGLETNITPIALAAGQTYTSDITVPAGLTLPAGYVLTSPVTLTGNPIAKGTIFSSDVGIEPVLALPSTFFQQGFSSYTIEAVQALAVTDNTQINSLMPVLRIVGDSRNFVSGTQAEEALQLWTPPLYQVDPIKATIAQRAGASLTLSTYPEYPQFGGSGPLSIGQGSVINVDPGQSITISGSKEIDIEGALNAPGGSISVVNPAALLKTASSTTYLDDVTDPNLSIWIGDSATLNVAAQAITGTDQFGRTFGLVPDAGSITLGSAYDVRDSQGVLGSSQSAIVIRPGAILAASGTSAIIDPDAGFAPRLGSDPRVVASNGGSILLSSYNGLYIDGTLQAFAGGLGAAGGDLSLVLETPIYATLPSDNATRHLRELTVSQNLVPTGIDDLTIAGNADPAMVVGTGRISAQQIETGGFGSLLLHGGDSTTFSGNVSLNLGQSLTIEDGRISVASTTPNASVHLSAPYVLLTGDIGEEPDPDRFAAYIQKSSAAPSDSIFSVNADLIDIEDPVSFGLHADITETFGPDSIVDLPAFGTVNLTSQGDIRFVAANNPTQVNSSTGQQFTSLTNTGDIELAAARIYPETNTPASIISSGTVTISRIGSGDVVTPNSVFGNLTISAQQVVQGGVVMAPLGVLAINAPTVLFLADSDTSTSAAGLTMPYGGTADGLAYYYDGTQVVFTPSFSAQEKLNPYQSGLKGVSGTAGITIASNSVDVEKGATLDLSGGGNLLGAGFVTGRGGSIDVERSPLVDANPSNKFSAASDSVYAIVPSHNGSYAPVSPDSGWGNPTIGEQVTIGNGVAGLPAGTYTLLPSIYATLPGAYRVEIGGNAPDVTASGKLTDGTYLTSGTLGIAGTAISNALPTRLLITPGTTVRSYSQYNETTYSQFAVSQASLFGTDLPLLPNDAKWLNLEFTSTAVSNPLTIQGVVNLNPAADGTDAGRASVVSVFDPKFGDATPIEIRTAEQAQTPGMISLVDSDLNALGGGSLIIGGQQVGGQIGATVENVINIGTDLLGGGGVILRSGVDLSAAAIWIPGSASHPIDIESGVTLSTVGKGPASWDSVSNDYLLQFGGVGLANADIWLAPVAASGSIASDVNLSSDGTIIVVGGSGFQVGAAPVISAKNLIIGGSAINIGTSENLSQASAAGLLPAGWSLNQDVLDGLLNPAPGGTALQNLTLIASGAVNLVGTVDLNTLDPTTGKPRASFVLETPALYGLGNGTATISTDSFVWSDAMTVVPDTAGNAVVTLATPSALTPNGPGTGSEQLVVNANSILLGFPTTSRTVDTSSNRLALGFSNVALNASQSISANKTGSLSVYQSGADPSVAFDPTGYAGTGGSLTLSTPLLTADSGAKIAFFTGGALEVAAPISGIGNFAAVTTEGGEIDLKANTVTIDTAIGLPTGKLSVLAANDIALGANAEIDLSGREVPNFDFDTYSWGGAASFESTSGNITQDAASIINVSAVNNAAGTVSFTATNASAGDVNLEGQVVGNATTGELAGGIDIRANKLEDFAGLNKRLDTGGVFGSRSFSIDTGDLTIENLKAQTIDVSVNGGSLTINGLLDASGGTPGTIRLAARDNLTLASSSILDAHGTVLQVDSYGQPIFSENQAHVELTATTGMMTLAPGATIDMRITDPRNIDANGNQLVNYGDLVLNVSRTCETCGDVMLSAPGSLNILGAGSIAIYGFWNYAPTDPNGSIVQDNGGSTGVGSNLLATATTTLETFQTVSTVSDVTEGPATQSVTFNDLPTAMGGGTYISFQTYVYFPGFCGGAYCSSAKVIAGQITDNSNGHVFSPTKYAGAISYFNTARGGSTFAPGTVIDVAGVPAGTVLFSLDGNVVKNDVPIEAPTATVVSSSTTHSTTGTPGTVTTPVTNPDGSQTVAQSVTTEIDTVLAAMKSSAADGTPLGSNSSTVIEPDGTHVISTDVEANPDAGFVGLNQINALNNTFINNAIANPTLLQRISGLTAYQDAFHLRPGVEIGSATPTGNLNTVGDLDFSGFRYASLNPHTPLTNVYGSGEPGSIVFRAGGNLNVNGSITDGFGPPPTTPDGRIVTSTITVPSEVVEAGIPTGQITFTALPTPNAALGQYIYTNHGSTYFIFGGAATITQGAIDDPLLGHEGQYSRVYGFSQGATFEAGTVLTFPNLNTGDSIINQPGGISTVHTFEQSPIWSAAPMLAPGSQSWSMRLVAGADLAAADTRLVLPKSVLDASGPPGAPTAGNITLSDNLSSQSTHAQFPLISVVRTGTGSLDVIAGENYHQDSLYGVYTAGTQDPNIDPAFNLARGMADDGTLLGAANTAYESADSGYQAYYPNHGGDLLLKAQGDITGYQTSYQNNILVGSVPSDAIGNWLWRQGGDGQSTAWWINFGTYAVLRGTDGGELPTDNSSGPVANLVGFDGIGTLGGGNVTVTAGGNAGVLSGYNGPSTPTTTALEIFVGSTGRVSSDGNIAQTGGGSLNINIGGALNSQTAVPQVLVGGNEPWGVIGDTRGNINIQAGAIGSVVPFIAPPPKDDPRHESPFDVTSVSTIGSPIFAPGDGTITIQTLRDISIGNVVDPGRVPLQNAAPVSASATSLSSFTLWKADTGVNLASAGGDVVPENNGSDGTVNDPAFDGVTTEVTGAVVYPPVFNVNAITGNIYLGGGLTELAPSPQSQLNMIAGESIIGEGAVWAISGAAPSTEATPQNPAFFSGRNTNFWAPISAPSNLPLGFLELFNFGADTPTSDVRADDASPARFYADSGDLFDVNYGGLLRLNDNGAKILNYISGAPLAARAGNDIVNFGEAFNLPLFTNGYTGAGFIPHITGLILNTKSSDVSVISAARDILYANTLVAGPGDLEVTAGRNIYQGDHGLIESIGPIVGGASADRSGGASVTLMAGVGPTGPDLTDFADVYLSNANQADPNFPLDFPQNQGKVVKSYEDDLFAWLKTRFGYAGTEDGALTYFLSLPSDQQLVFASNVYFQELDGSDVEFNDPSSRRFQSYVRGKQAIAELFPSSTSSGTPITRAGNLTLASGLENIYPATAQSTAIIWDSGVHTEFGGDINILTPGGSAVLGAESITPGASTGLLTEGSGNINIYADGSIPLGLSRVFTTFGGDITMWSATGDINAGRGAKGTVLFTPVRRTYDQFGNVALAPTVPSSGAGIATLAPIPGVPPGDVFLVAPEGTIDAGEAGIRVSGNVYLAALQVVNAANIQVKGQAFGLPPKPVTNLSFTAASNASTEAANIVRQMAKQPQTVISVEVTGFGGGDTDQPAECISTVTNHCN